MGRREAPKKYTGITPRNNSTLISFTYQGKRCRETIRGKPTATRLKAMSDKRSAILYEISIGMFNYGLHFPQSKNAIKYSQTPGSLISVEKALKEWLVRNKKRWALSTSKDYNQSVYSHLIPSFGGYLLDEITPSIVKDWVTQQTCSNKRINNILSPLRQMYKDAYYEEIISKNPMDKVRSLQVVNREPKPFNLLEIDKILSQATGSIKNLFQFAFWSGLRTSELIALKWDDIDWEKNRLYVRRARVRGVEKTTKTKSGLRTVTLQQEAKKH